MGRKGRHNAHTLTQAHDGPEDDKPMPLLDHLIELRKRLIWALVSFFGVFFITFYFAKPIQAQTSTSSPTQAHQDNTAKV